MNNKKVIIVGAGPGGLASAMILSHRGYDVTMYEKANKVGGRTSPIKVDEYTFDLGPTFVMLPQIFEEVFDMSGKNIIEIAKKHNLFGICQYYALFFQSHFWQY